MPSARSRLDTPSLGTDPPWQVPRRCFEDRSRNAIRELSGKSHDRVMRFAAGCHDGAIIDLHHRLLELEQLIIGVSSTDHRIGNSESAGYALETRRPAFIKSIHNE